MGQERDYAGKSVIVTGGASGLGRALVRLLSDKGARVIVADRDGSGAEAVAAELAGTGSDVRAVAVDVTDENAVTSAIDAVVNSFGRLDALFNVAAATSGDLYTQDNALIDLDSDIWDGVMAVNLRGVMLTCKHGVRAMLRSGGGAIVNVSSAGAHQGKDSGAAYGASKAGVEALTRYVATMYGADGVRCNAVAPGYMATADTAGREPEGQSMMSAYERLLPDAATPGDVAAVCAFLGSDAARAVTGQVYVADSGRLAMKPSVAVERALRDRIG